MSDNYARRIVSYPTLPAVCDAEAGELAYLQGGNRGLYRALNDNEWVKLDNLKIVNIEDFGARGDGVSNNTTAINDAINSLGLRGGTIFFPEGFFLFDDIEIPAYPKIVNLRGCGLQSTILQPFTADTRLFHGQLSGINGPIGNIIGNFSIRAHAASSVGPAVDLSNFRATSWRNIEFLMNGAGQFASGFRLQAGAAGCYKNILDSIAIHDQARPVATLVLCENAGNPANNANGNIFKNFWVHGAINVDCVIDATRTAMCVVENCIFEGNTNCTVIKPGTKCAIHSNWFELNNIDVLPEIVAGGASNGVTFADNYIGSPGTINIIAGLSDWNVFHNVPEVNLVVNDVDAKSFIVVGKKVKQGLLLAGPQNKANNELRHLVLSSVDAVNAMELIFNRHTNTHYSIDVIEQGIAGRALVLQPTGGFVGIGMAPTSPFGVSALPIYADNAAAIVGGLTAGAFYRTNADPDQVCVVH